MCKNYDVIILAGQSNAEGCGLGACKNEYIENPKILQVCDNSFPHMEQNSDGKAELVLSAGAKPFFEPLRERRCDNGPIGNFSLSFAQNYAADLPENGNLIIVNAAVGGTGFARGEWGVNSPLLNRLFALTDYALLLGNCKIKAFLWHQGECDSVENPEWSPEKRYEVHKRNLTENFSAFYKRYSDYYNGDLPLIAGEFSNEWYKKNKIPCDAVLTAIREVCTSFGGEFVTTSDLPNNDQSVHNGDDLHFSREALWVLGERYYSAYKRIINKNK